MRTAVYIDAFNLYFGALKKTSSKWLNLETWLDRQFPKNDIVVIKYFTARVKEFNGSCAARDKQAAYLEALATLARVEVIEGHYLVKEVSARLASSPTSGSPFVKVVRAEEKQSDVNLASHLLVDGFQNRYDVAIVITGDGDLATPVKMVQRECGKKVVVLNPQRRSSYHLEQSTPLYRGTHYRMDKKQGKERKVRNDGIRAALLGASQFPDPLVTKDGEILMKPSDW